MKRTIERLVVSEGIASGLSISVIPAEITNSNIDSVDTDFNVGLKN